MRERERKREWEGEREREGGRERERETDGLEGWRRKGQQHSQPPPSLTQRLRYSCKMKRNHTKKDAKDGLQQLLIDLSYINK